MTEEQQKQIADLTMEVKLYTGTLDLLKNYCRYGISDAQKAAECYHWLNLKKQFFEEKLREVKKAAKDAKAAE